MSETRSGRSDAAFWGLKLSDVVIVATLLFNLGMTVQRLNAFDEWRKAHEQDGLRREAAMAAMIREEAQRLLESRAAELRRMEELQRASHAELTRRVDRLEGGR